MYNKEIHPISSPQFNIDLGLDYLESKVFTLLYYKLNNLCSFEDLLQAWDYEFVEFHSLYRIISSLRNKLKKHEVGYKIVSKSKLGYYLKPV
ncbi:helix-turn-helix domain-containing protein [Pseudoalteromonas nigrifaciens]|uniref:helix-turn-helix domain-containing protein n=1 Tax=Pseudoalteromonas nigrifaciens TaxID=28109 RepID=UPI003D07D327